MGYVLERELFVKTSYVCFWYCGGHIDHGICKQWHCEYWMFYYHINVWMKISSIAMKQKIPCVWVK